MASLNKVQLIGNIGNAPTSRVKADGTPVVSFRVATTEGWKDRESGERRESTEWHSVVCYRQLAEFVRDYLGKGRQVYIEGKLRTRKWTDKEGIDRYTTEVVADEVQPLGARPQGAGERPEPTGQAGGAPAGMPEDDDDLPY